MADLVVIGEILVEIMARERGQSFERPGLWEGPFPSGAPAIFADQAARCGAGTAMIGRVGDDGFGRLNRNRLDEAGVDTRFVRTHPGLPTGSAFVAYREDGARDFVFNIKGAACGTLAAEDVDPAAFAGCRVLHVMGSSLFTPEAITRAVGLARQAGALLSLDPNVRKELVASAAAAALLRDLVDQADLLMPSREDLAWLVPDDGAEAAAQRLCAKREGRRVFLKDGARGTLYVDARTTVPTPSFEVEEVDPTGAGDACGATFVACHLIRGLPLKRSLRLANAAGASAVTHRGPMAGNTGIEALDRRFGRGEG